MAARRARPLPPLARSPAPIAGSQKQRRPNLLVGDRGVGYFTILGLLSTKKLMVKLSDRSLSARICLFQANNHLFISPQLLEQFSKEIKRNLPNIYFLVALLCSTIILHVCGTIRAPKCNSFDACCSSFSPFKFQNHPSDVPIFLMPIQPTQAFFPVAPMQNMERLPTHSPFVHRASGGLIEIDSVAPPKAPSRSRLRDKAVR